MSRRLPAPVLFNEDVDLFVERCFEAAYMAKKLKLPFAESYDHSLSSVRSGSLAPARTSWVKSDPTGDVATSGLYVEMRRRVRLGVKRMDHAVSDVNLAGGELLEMFLDLDQGDPFRVRRA